QLGVLRTEVEDEDGLAHHLWVRDYRLASGHGRSDADGIVAALSRTLLLLPGLLVVSCAHARVAPQPPLFPMRTAWTASFADVPEGPLVADETRLFVATRDGFVRALDQGTGRVLWELPDRPARLAAGRDALVLRQLSGTVVCLQAGSGAVRWS